MNAATHTSKEDGTMIEFGKDWTKEDHKLAAEILTRTPGNIGSVMERQMDLSAALNHASLAKLATFEGFDLAHDVFGIANNLDRETGEMDNCFRPRCSC